MLGGLLRGRLVQAFLVSGMGFVHYKPIPDVWLRILFHQTHSSNPQGMRISYPRGEVGMKRGFQESKLFSFIFIIIYIISCKFLTQNEINDLKMYININLMIF